MIELTRTTEITFRSSSIARSIERRRSPRFEPRAMTTVKRELPVAGCRLPLEIFAGNRSPVTGNLLLRGVDFIGKLVHVAGRSRKVLFQMLARGVDRLHDSIGELAVLESYGELRGDFVPEAGGDFLVDAAVAKDDELPRLGGDEEQHAISMGRPGHSEAFE